MVLLSFSLVHPFTKAYINAICSHGHKNKVYLPRSVCHPSLLLHVFPRNVESGCPCPELVHILCASALSSLTSIRAGPGSYSSSVFTNLTHCPYNAVVTSRSQTSLWRNTLQSYWIFNRCTYAYMGHLQRHIYRSSTGKVR